MTTKLSGSHQLRWWAIDWNILEYQCESSAIYHVKREEKIERERERERERNKELNKMRTY